MRGVGGCSLANADPDGFHLHDEDGKSAQPADQGADDYDIPFRKEVAYR